MSIKYLYTVSLLPLFIATHSLAGDISTTPTATFADNQQLHKIASEISATRIETDIKKLVGFGTRHTLSETESETRGICATRRWIKADFDKI
jgi:hypothetical protein